LGRKEIELAEAEMPGLMALRAEYKTNNHLLVLVLLDVYMTIKLRFNRNFNCSWC
jgi:S-adenosylhomocysteine hydrolase